MKNLNNKTDKIKQTTLSITASLYEESILENLVEELAYRRIDIGYSRALVPAGHKALETSSIEAHVSGEMSITTDNDSLHMPFVTCFLFTCIKTKGKDYKFSWVNSLS